MSGLVYGNHDHSSSGHSVVGAGAERSAWREMGHEINDGVGDELRCLDQRTVALALQNGDASVREHVRQRVDGLARMRARCGPRTTAGPVPRFAHTLMSGWIESSELMRAGGGASLARAVRGRRPLGGIPYRLLWDVSGDQMAESNLGWRERRCGSPERRAVLACQLVPRTESPTTAWATWITEKIIRERVVIFGGVVAIANAPRAGPTRGKRSPIAKRDGRRPTRCARPRAPLPRTRSEG